MSQSALIRSLLLSAAALGLSVAAADAAAPRKAAISPGKAAIAPTVVRVAQGQARGVAKGGVVAFLGLPYAAPPVGALRWASPRAPAAWRGVRDAREYSASCPQVLNPAGGRLPWTPEFLIPGKMSEDCLYLNVWRPAKVTGKTPVLFWIHGGGAVEGSTSVPVYDGANLAKRGIIVVSVNYRLGVLASLSHPELSREQGGVSGNYALQDNIAALRWTHDNIAAFGGDPARITISGQSAGSSFVAQLIASPAARGLFAQAISESGSRWGQRPGPVAPAVAEAQGGAFAASLGAASLARLRAMPADQLITRSVAFTAAGGRFPTVLDGHYVTVDANRAQARPGFNDTPILTGFNADEESGMDPKFQSWTLNEFNKKRDQMFSRDQAAAARLYAASSDAEARNLGQVMARENTRATIYEWAKRRAPASRNPAYVYFFSHPLPGPDQARYGSFHSSEIPYVFGNLDAPRPFTAADRAISEHMASRWVAFIKSGSPNAPGLPIWSRFDPARPTVMMLGDKEVHEPFLPPAKIALADRQADPD
jgi:para-nitrobenzyl esterase